MTIGKEIINTRILTIDDEELVRDNIEEILVPRKVQKNATMVNASSILFEAEEEPLLSVADGSIPVFYVDKAINGMEGLEMVKKAVAAQKPYAVIFIDMRMPGWDGLETTMRIREVDTKAEIIIVTAFSDKSIEDIIAKAGQHVGYHCKPYATEEILQLATKGVNDYNKLRNLETLIAIIANLSISENHLNSLLQNILDQLAMYVNTDIAILGKLYEDHTYEKLFSIGTLEEQLNIPQLIHKISLANVLQEEVVQVDEVVFVKLQDYAIFAILNKNIRLKTEKLYLLRLFVQNAAKAICNAQLYEKLLKKEKLSAIGTAMGMLIHDLRTPIKNIPVITEMMRIEGNNSPFLALLEKCGEQSVEIFDDFMDFLNESPLKKVRINISSLIKEGIGLANDRRTIAPIKLIASIDEDLYTEGDSSKLKRVIINLISNAVDALKNANVQDAMINVSARLQDDKIIIILKDNGPGIPDEIRKNLFDAFITKEKANGTGLGLAIVKQFVLAHGGEITVENKNGALFTICLPVAD